MKLTFELMQQLHRGEITPAEAFKLAGGTCQNPEVAKFQNMPCDQLAERVDAARADIRDNGPDALRDLLKQTDALLARKPHWNKCQRAARFRSILAKHAAARSSAGVLPATSVVSRPLSVEESTDHGPRITDHGPRTTDHGQLTTDHGQQATDDQPCSTELRRQCPEATDVYLIGKGPSLDALTTSDFPIETAPVICCNESIHAIEALGLPNPLFCVQQDAALEQRCRPEQATWFLSGQAWAASRGDTYERAVKYDAKAVGGSTKSLTANQALRIIGKAGGFTDVHFLAFDACVSGDCGYADSIGEEPTKRRKNGERFLGFCKEIKAESRVQGLAEHWPDRSAPSIPEGTLLAGGVPRRSGSWAHEDLDRLAEGVRGVSGDFAEIGVFRGAAFSRLARLAEASGRMAHAIDSFVGMAEPGEHDGDRYPKGRFGIGGPEAFRDIMDRNGVQRAAYQVHAGYVPQVLDSITPETRFALAVIDLDHYQPTVDAMRWVWDHLEPGGIMALDDYYPGQPKLASRAIGEWLAKHHGYTTPSLRNHQLIIRKSGVREKLAPVPPSVSNEPPNPLVHQATATWTVVCVLRSGGEYTADHVRWLQRQCQDKVEGEFRFVCLTDLEQIDGVEALGLIHGWPGWWSKIELFRPGLFSGPVVYLDLDMVIMRNVELPAPETLPANGIAVHREIGHADKIGSALMFWRPDAAQMLYGQFLTATDAYMERFRGDQDFIHHVLMAKHGVEAIPPWSWASYKWHIRQHGPDGVDIAAFHGKPRPWSVQEPWIPPLSRSAGSQLAVADVTQEEGVPQPTRWRGTNPFTDEVLSQLEDAGLKIVRPDLDAYRERWAKVEAEPHETRELPPVGEVTLRGFGSSHLGDTVILSSIPRLLHQTGYRVIIRRNRATEAVFGGNPFTSIGTHNGAWIEPSYDPNGKGHILQQILRKMPVDVPLLPSGELYLTAEELAWAYKEKKHWPSNRPVIVLSTGSVSSASAYLGMDWQAIVDALQETCTVIAPIVTDPSRHVGVKNSSWQRPDIGDFRPKGCKVYENLPTRHFMALLAVADGGCGTMAGASHVAAALGTPYVVVLPTERPEGFSLAFPLDGSPGACDARWLYPQHIHAIPTECPGGFPLSREQTREQIIHPDERKQATAGRLSHIVSKYLVAKRFSATRVVEVGVRYGYSAAGILLALPGAKYHGIDIVSGGKGAHGGIGRGTDTFPYVREMLSRVTSAEICLEHLNSQVMPSFPKADFYHIDGDHTTHGALSDICKAFAACDPGGVVLVDDYDSHPPVRMACDMFCRQNAALISRAWRWPSWRGEFVIEKAQDQRAILNVHYQSGNCGDWNCAPHLYFGGMVARPMAKVPISCRVVVFGGGGVYHRDVFERAKKYRALGAKIVIWGAGIVTENRAVGMTPWNWREFGDMADLCGLREPSPWELVPCPSCMSPLFDEFGDVEPAHDVVYYNHPDKPVRPGEPRMTNYDPTDMATALRFLASGRRVVTSSYHGRIWATWLGREVELDGPAAAQLSKSGDPHTLSEARRLTKLFSEKVASLC
jgi:hypothetical protein